MARKYRVLKISDNGELTDEDHQGPVLCPIRGGNCTSKCAWYSLGAGTGLAYCQNTVIGAIRHKPLKSFRLYVGPDV